MGLDIYMIKRPVNSSNCCDDEAPVGYFRKVNSLLYWVHTHVAEVENCVELELNKRHLEMLLTDLTCLTKENCEERFPTACGFFFGSVEYDEYYWQDVEEVKSWVTETLNTFDFRNHRLCFLAWW